MDIKKEVTVTMNVKEIEIILKEWVEKHKGLKVDSVYFNIGSHEQEGDWRSEFPTTHRLDNVTLKGTEK
jgi:hypothetical protein